MGSTLRTTTAVLVAVVAALTGASPAAADDVVRDPCGVAAVGSPPQAYPDPTIPWLDLCDTTVAARPGPEGLRTVEAVVRVAGDLDLRARTSGFLVALRTPRCAMSLAFRDAGLDSDAGEVLLRGQCNQQEGPCTTVPVAGCVLPTSGSSERIAVAGGPALSSAIARTAMAGSTLTLRFDPAALAGEPVPDALLEDLAGTAPVTAPIVASSIEVASVAQARRIFVNYADVAFGDAG